VAARRPRNRSETKSSQRELDRSSLRGAALFALQRLAVLEESPEKAAAALKTKLDARAGAFADVTVEQITGWFAKGVPKEILADPVKVAMIFTDVSSMTRAHEVTGLDETALARKAKHQKLAYTGLLDPKELEPDEDPSIARRVGKLDQIRAAKRIKAIAERIAKAKAERRDKRSLASIVAEQLKVKPSTARRWLKEGKVSKDGVYKLKRYDLEEKGDREVEREERKIFAELLKAGRKPHTIRKKGARYWDPKKAKWVTPVKTEQAPVVPTFRGSEGYYGGDGTSGYRWNMRVAAYLTPTLLAQMKRMALSVPMEAYRKRIRRKLPEWTVFVVVSALYVKDGDRGHPVKSAAGRLYGQNVRSDLEPKFPEHANRFVVKDVYSSGNHPTLETAAVEFDKRMWREIKSGDRVYVHGLVVWNFRRRTTDEQAERIEARRLQAKEHRARKKRLTKAKFGKTLRQKGKAAKAEFDRRKKDES
jgi:hypothetical protein